MSDWSIFINFGSGYEDVTYHCDQPTRTIILHNNLEPVINTCRFIIHDKTTALKFNTDNDLPLLIQKDAVNWFVGFVRPNFENIIGADFDYIGVEGYDKGILLQKTVNQTLSYSSFKLSDPTNKSSSILHQLFYEAGFVDAELDFSLIDETLDEFVIDKEDNTTYWDQVRGLISEFGYVFNDPGDGVFELTDLFPATLSGDLIEDSDIYDKMKMSKKERPYEAVRIEYHPHKTLTGVILFSDSTGGSSAGLCSIPLLAGEWYPDGSDVNDVYSKYDPGDGYEVIAASSVTLSWTHTADVSLDTFTAGIKKALVKFESTSGGTITKFNIVGTVVVRDMNDIRRSVRYNVAASEKIKTIPVKNLTTETQAKRLANGMADWYKYSDYVYEFDADIDNGGYAPGDILEFDEAVMGTDTIIRIIEVVEDSFGNQKIRAEGVSELVLNDVEIENSITSVPSITIIRPEVEWAVEEAITAIYTGIQSGYTQGGGTTTPTITAITECRAVGAGGIRISWDRQLNLTNFSKYQIQVSANGTDWYSLKFDGTDWKDTLNSYTEIVLESLLHANIPHGGTSEAPTGTTLYYRVRRVTKADANGDWNDPIVSATTHVIGAGELAEDTIYANNIIASEIQTFLLRATTLRIGYHTGGAGTLDAPEEGDTMCYIDSNQLYFAEYTAGGWTTMGKPRIGYIATAFVAALFGCALCNPATTPGEELLPNSRFRAYAFDNTYDDQNGEDTWTTKDADNAFVADIKKFGTYALCAADTTYGQLTGDTSGTWGSNQVFAAWVYTSLSDHQAHATSSSVLMYLVGANNQSMTVYFYKNGETNDYFFRASIRKNTAFTPVSIDSSVFTSAGWHYIAMIYNAVTDMMTFLCDETYQETAELGDSWVGGGLYLSMYPARNYNMLYGTVTWGFDDLIHCFDEGVTIELLLQHYNHDLPWFTEYSQADTTLIPATENDNVYMKGNAIVKGQLSVLGGSRVVATRGALQTIANNTYTTVIWDAEETDNLSEYNTSTGIFTAQKSGFYMVNANVLFDSYAWAAGDVARLILYINGVSFSSLCRVTAVGATYYLELNGVGRGVNLYAGDTVDIRIHHNRGANTNIYANSVFNHFSIFKVQ